jgi:translation initiation factor IF-3
MQTLLKNARKFLEEGDKVRVTCMFRQRELARPENGTKRLNFFAEQLNDLAMVDRPPNLEGRQMTMVLTPRPTKPAGKKDAKDQDEQNRGEAVQDHGNGEDNPTQVGE